MTKGVLSKILQGLPKEQIGKICLQILRKKVLENEPEKCQLMLSDGIYATPYCVYYDRDDTTLFMLEKLQIKIENTALKGLPVRKKRQEIVVSVYLTMRFYLNRPPFLDTIHYFLALK